MKYLNKLASVFFIAMLGMLTMTSCEGGDLYDIGSPEWLSEMGGGEEDDSNIITVIPNPTTLGNTDNTTGWWSAFSEYFTLEENKTLKLEFDNYSAMSANSDNWILLLTNDKARGEEGYAEYAAIRVDNWGWSPTGDKDNTSWYTAWTSNYNWDVFKQAMNGSHVVMTITRGGNVVNAHADIAGSDGNSYFEDVVLPCGEDGTQNIRAFLTTERGHLLINDTKTTVTDTKITGEITESGYSSFSSFFPLDLSSIDGATANAATGIQNYCCPLKVEKP